MRIIDDDAWLVEDASDAEDSVGDSQDSNAEGFHSHEYPDDDFGSERSDDDSEASEAESEVRSRTIAKGCTIACQAISLVAFPVSMTVYEIWQAVTLCIMLLQEW